MEILPQYTKDNNLKREIIMEHYSSPKLKTQIEKADVDHYSQQCVDELHIKWEFASDKLKSANWDGKGCAIFQSSADIFLGYAIGKTKEEIINLANKYEDMIHQRETNIDEEHLKELSVFHNVKTQLNRLYCADMISQAILKTLKG